MKKIIVACLLLPALAGAIEPSWLQERFTSTTVSQELMGRGETLPLQNYLRLPPNVQLNRIMVTAASAQGRGGLELIIDGRSLGQINVGLQLETFNIPVNAPLFPRSRLELRSFGRIYVAEVGATFTVFSSPSPVPGPVPPAPPFETRKVCEEFAFVELRGDGYSKSDALNLASEFCRKNEEVFSDRQMFKRLYGLLREDGYTRRDALNLTGDHIRQNRGNIQYREQSYMWFFDRLREDGYTRFDSMKLTVDLLSRAPEQSMSCVIQRFEIIRRDGYTRKDSISKAIDSCSR